MPPRTVKPPSRASMPEANSSPRSDRAQGQSGVAAQIARRFTMPELPVDASQSAGMWEEPARTSPRRTVVDVELTDARVAAMPKMISPDAHVMEPDALWQELTPRLREHLPKVPFRNNPPGASDPHLRLRDPDTDGVAAEILFPNYGMALFGLQAIR